MDTRILPHGSHAWNSYSLQVVVHEHYLLFGEIPSVDSRGSHVVFPVFTHPGWLIESALLPRQWCVPEL